MTNFDYGDGPGRNYGETAVFMFCRKVENGLKIRFFPTKHPKLAESVIFIGEKGTFSFPQLCPVVARTWLEKKKCIFWARKSVHMGPLFLAQVSRHDGNNFF